VRATARGALNLEDLSVLLVEEDAEFRATTAEMLHALGLRDVVLAGTESDAIAEIKRRVFDALLCSHRLGIGGRVLKAVRRASPETRAILITVYAPAAQVLARALGDAEVLEKPFSLPTLELVLRRVASGVRGLRGEVQELSLVDLLQMYHYGRQSIAVTLSGPVSGRVRLAKGEIVQAEAGSLRGIPALSRLLGASTGMISTELAPVDGESNIQGSFQSMIFEAAAEHDEQRRSTPPGASMHDLNRSGLHLAVPAPFIAPSVPPSMPQPASSRFKREFGATAALAVLWPRFRGWFVSREPWQRWVSIAALLASLMCIVVYLLLAPVAGDGSPHSAEPAAPDPAPVVALAQPHLEAARTSDEAGSELSAHHFRLLIDSDPAPAQVTENGVVLGKTPLALDIERRSVASVERRFVLTREGYAPYLLEQGDSKSALRVVAKLVPAHTALRPRPAGRPALPTRSAASAPPDPAARGEGTGLDIRLQR
jgi:CheY-like chemotaxis protein